MQEETKQVTGIVFSVTVRKSGMTNGRNWTIYEVIIAGESYSTFDATYKEMIGKQGTFNYIEKQNTGSDGRVYTNKTLQVLPKPEAPPGAPKTIQISEVVVNTLLSNQAKIIKLLTPGSQPTIPNEEIPIVEDGPPPIN